MVRGPPYPLNRLSLADSGLVNTMKSIVNPILTEEGPGVLPTNIDKSVENTSPIMPLTAYTTTRPSHFQLSTPLSTPLESPCIVFSSAAEDASKSTVLQLTNMPLPNDNRANNCEETLYLYRGPNNDNISVKTITRRCNKASNNVVGSTAFVRLCI